MIKIQFASLSKYNSPHANSFDLGVFSPFIGFQVFSFENHADE
jgi:hypothetical protein